MRNTEKSTGRWYAAGFGVLLAPVLLASIAYACSSLATLSIDQASAEPGQTINASARSFARGSDAEISSPIEARLGSRSGQLLWSGRPDADGNASFSFVVPQVSPGQYTIIALQNGADGKPLPGSPARVVLAVTGLPAPAAPVVATPAESTPAGTPVVASTPAPVVAPSVARQPAARVAPAPSAAPAPVVAATPTPVVAVPAPVPVPAAVAEPAPAVVPAAPAPTPAPASRRSVMVSMASSHGSPWLAISLVGVGLVLSLGATALVVAGRRERKAPVGAHR